ncbi:MAG: hypothetical protein M3150_03285 [Pseudomonadota bacterium]|nr:hypothetical protein [Pseudomonadota bacterium]
MSLFKRIFATATPAPQSLHSQPASQVSVPATVQNNQNPLAQQNASRRELLRLVLRDSLNRTGIPTSWIGADLLAATSRGREPGIHMRLLLKHWDPRVMQHGIAFENVFRKRVLTLDPLSDRWLLGISWQFSLADDSNCPTMPHPGVWTSSVPTAASLAAAEAATAAVAGAAMNASDPADLLGGSIVISGPAHASDSSAARPAAAAANARAEAKADLDRLFAIRDQDVQRHSHGSRADAPSFAATEPATLHDLPIVLPYPATVDTDVQNSFAKTDVFRRPVKPV